MENFQLITIQEQKMESALFGGMLAVGLFIYLGLNAIASAIKTRRVDVNIRYINEPES